MKFRWFLLIFIITTFVLTWIFMYRGHVIKKRAEEDFLNFLELRLDNDFEISSVNYSWKNGIYRGEAVNLDTNEKYHVYYWDKNKDMDMNNIGYTNLDTHESYSPFEYDNRLSVEKALSLFLDSYNDFVRCAEYFCETQVIRRVFSNIPDYAYDWLYTWGDQNQYNFSITLNNISYNTDQEISFETTLNEELQKSFFNLHSNLIYCGNSDKGCVDFLLYIEPTGYSIHAIYASDGNIEDIYPNMAIEATIDDNWYITTLNKDLMDKR